MIEERRCSYEVCKLLHEKGFDEKCDYFYEHSTDEPHEMTRDEIVESCNLCIKAPTHQMACDWLLTKGIYICPKYCCFQGSKKNDKPYCRWEPTILSLTSSFPLYPQPLDRCEYFVIFEEAVEAALKYSLKNLV